MKKRSKHDRLVAELEERLDDSPVDYDVIDNHVEYDMGEIDLYAIRGNRFLMFEIKCNDTLKARNKAYDQLKRARDNFCESDEVFYGFMVYGTEDGYCIERVV